MIFRSVITMLSREGMEGDKRKEVDEERVEMGWRIKGEKRNKGLWTTGASIFTPLFSYSVTCREEALELSLALFLGRLGHGSD